MDIEVKIQYKNDKLQAARKAAGLSQSQLAEAAEINVRTLQHYEQGSKDINTARLETILKICNALKCQISDILSDPEVLALLSVYEKRK